jgi:hypothetical protein
MMHGRKGSCTKFGAQYGIRNPRTGRNKRRTFASSISGKNTETSGGWWKSSFWSLRETVKTAMSPVGTGSPTSKTLKKRCSNASRHITRSGSIPELNGTRANCRRAEKDRQRDWGVCKAGEGRGGWSREVLTPSAGDDVDFCVVAIFGCHLKEKGNKISQHLLPKEESAALCCCVTGPDRVKTQSVRSCE